MRQRAESSHRRCPTQIVGGVDTHQDLHTAAVVSLEGAVLGTESFSTTRAGYRAMLRWFRAHGELLRVGVESTGSYGAGVTRHLALAGVPVPEVTGPDRSGRHARGKDDTLDAVAAAEAARTGRRVQVAKDRSGAVEALRVLRTTRKTAIKCRRATLQQLHSTVVAAPEEVRDQVRALTRMQRLRVCAVWRPDALGYRDPVVATRIALKRLARRVLELNDEIAELDRFIEPLVEELAPSLLALEGVGTTNAGELIVAAGENPERLRTEAGFATMCGVCPIPASSGKPQRHRLNRGGNRQANSTPHMIVVCRMRTDPRTRAYVARRLRDGLSKALGRFPRVDRSLRAPILVCHDATGLWCAGKIDDWLEQGEACGSVHSLSDRLEGVVDGLLCDQQRHAANACQNGDRRVRVLVQKTLCLSLADLALDR